MPPDPNSQPKASGRLTFPSGFEGTQMFGHGTNVLDTSEHTWRFAEDLGLLAGHGVTTFRCCIPWHKIEQVRGVFDWAWTDRYLRRVRQLGLRPIVDPLHQTSFPVWLTQGFANPQFPRLYSRFLEALALRYPWVTDCTIINEPVATAILSGFMGVWHPYWRGRGGVALMILGMVRAIHRATALLHVIVPGLRNVDTCERHHALDAGSQDHADFSNPLRFAVLDLLLGRMTVAHLLWSLFLRHGLTADELALYRDQPARIDVLGLDYYAHSEMGWTVAANSDAFRPLGFAGVAMECVARYPFDVMLSETNVRGRIEDRMTWLKYMLGECETLSQTLHASGWRLEGFCWYPFIDSLLPRPARQGAPEVGSALAGALSRDAREGRSIRPWSSRSAHARSPRRHA